MLFTGFIFLAFFLKSSDSAVTFTYLPDSKSIAESVAVGSTVYTTAPDNGTAPYTCSITLQTPDDAVRRFGFAGVDVETTLALDYESETQYVLTIECADSTPATATSSLTVNVQDVIDETPVIQGTLSVNIDEELSIGTAVTGLFNVSDGDAGDVMTYALSGSDTSYFQIDPSSGTISVKTELDRDAVAARTVFNQLNLIVTDQAGASATASLTITLDDINDNTPTFSPGIYYVTVAENESPAVSLVTLTCTDPDLTGNGNITYAIASGDDASPKFTLSGNEVRTSTNPIDYESLSGQNFQYQLILTGTDGGTTPNTGTGTVIVQVTPENDATPAWGTFTPAYVAGQPYSVQEDDSVGTTVVTIAATDADDGVDGTLSYSIVSITDEGGGSQPGVFRINSVSGAVMTNVQLERDPPSGAANYTIVVRATDNGSPARSVDRSLEVTITDVNDNSPAFPVPLYDVTLNEDESPATSVLALTATDNDESSTFSYSIFNGNGASKFQIASNELQIQTAIDLDSPNNDASFYTLVLRVLDGGTPPLTGSTTVLVTIAATNDFDPVFGTANTTVSIPENTVLGAVVTTIAATDADAGIHGTVTYSISSGNTGGNFYLNSNTGVIKLVRTIDFDGLALNPVELVVVASDGGGRTDTGTVTVTITDVNDHSPSCSPTSLSVSIDENMSTGSNVQTLTCSDQDTSDTLSYVINSGNTGNVFNVTSSGIVELINAVDYESTTIYFLTVEVSDGSNTADVQITVNINPINEATPAFSSSQVNVTWAEDTPTSTVLTTYTATDADSGTDGQITYAISSVTQSGSSNFQIDSATGKLVLVKELDYETLSAGSKYYVLAVTATDGSGAQGSGTVTVSVTDVNDNTPSCNPSFRSLSTAENTNAGSLPLTLFASLTCSDADDGLLGTLTYGLSQTPAGSHFAVDNSTGAVTLISALDYETASSYTLKITVTDGGSPTAKSTTVTAVITVTSVNDGGPVFSGTFAQTLAESVPLEQFVDDVIATDPDSSSSPEGELIYSINSGDVNNNFVINSATGRVKVSKALDRETVSSYELVIQAIEKVGTYSASTTLTVNVTDVNDNAPSCPSVSIVTSIDEDAAVNDVIQSLTCTDADDDPSFGTVSYSITSGDSSVFQMAGSDLTLKSLVDYDLGTRSYSLVITASDGTNTEAIHVTVNLNPINEAAPTFTNAGSYAVDVAEDKTTGSSVVTVSAPDSDSADTSHGQVQYSFVTTYANFQIDADSGVITLQSSLDRESVDSFELLVVATDGSLSATATVTVNVTDVNDNAPVFGSTVYSGSLSEADAAGASVIQNVSATDQDDPSTSNNGVVTYSITGGNPGGVFTINTMTGEITSASSVDYDSLSTPSYSLTVVAADRFGAVGSLSSTAIVTILVTNDNDNSPVFSPSSYNETVLENLSLGSLVTQVTCNDADAGNDGIIFYTMASHPKFYLDQSTGAVTLKDILDYETDTTYTLSIVATDKGSPAQSSTAMIYVTVDDVNDNTPECSPVSLAVPVREDASLTTTLATLMCTDADDQLNGALSYSIYSVNGVLGNGPFNAMNSSDLVLGSTLDYESTSSYTVVIRVTDAGSPVKSSLVEVVVSVSDVNENDPVFTGTPYSKNVAENAAVGDSIFKVAAGDVDSDNTLTFTLNPDSPEFSLDSQSGDVRVNGPLDRETTDSYNLTVLVTDSGNVDAPRSASTSLIITITDINDNVPIFTPASYSFSLPENTTTGATVLSLTSNDQDSGSNGDITYSINSGNIGNVFRVEKDIPSGECRLIVDDATNLDFDSMTSYSLIIQATDGGGQNTEAGVHIQVTGYNDFLPVFSPSSSSTESVAEDSSVNDVVIDLNATDADAGVDGQITYSISSGAFAKFSIDPSSGIVVVSGSLDKETTPSYTMDVIAVDGGTIPFARTATYSLTVSLIDVNDVMPVCTRSMYSASISENTSPSVAVSQPSCIDGDFDSPNKDLVYSITGGTGSSLFDINPGTGLVSTAAGSSFDRESVSEYNISIEVADQGTPSLAETVDMVIVISDENDNTPQFCCSPYSVTVAEDITIDTSLYQVTATDADDSLSGTIIYSISSGNTGAKFTIDGSSGVIRNSATVDRETLSAYNLTILATDAGSPANTGTATVMIDLTDVNDNAPSCSASFYYGNVAENVSAGISVVTLSCSDNDVGVNAAITYTLLTGAVPFSIDSSSGLVSVSGSLDVESTALYDLDVMVSDPTLTENVTVIVYITDINEHVPVFNPTGPYTVSANEDDSVGTAVADLNATDSDLTNNSFAFSITGGNTGSAFQINPSTGLVRISKQLDYETDSKYLLEVTVADGSGMSSLSSSTTLTVSLVDVNDNPPVCNPETYLHSANETATGSLLTLTCTDADTVSVSLTYTILSGNTNGDLQLDVNTGELSIASSLDYENTTSYDLTIEVSDGQLSTTVVVSVIVDGVNEYDPVFPVASYPITVDEDTSPGTAVLNVTATDQDAGQHGSVTYSIVAGNSDNKFTVEETTGVIKVFGALNREQNAIYNLTVRANDDSPGSPNRRTSDVPVDITVNDVNDNRPIFTPTSYVISVTENAAPGSVLVAVGATDDDEGLNSDLIYSITVGNANTIFAMNGNSVEIASGKSLDYETSTFHALTIEVSDQGTPPLNAYASVSIQVLPVNEFTPTFSSNATVTIPENMAVGAVILTASAVDNDTSTDGDIVYSILSGNSPGTPFIINSYSGQVQVWSALDFDTAPQSYTLVLLAKDQNGNNTALSSTMTFSVTLTDINDETPTFSQNSYYFNLNENIPGSSSVGNVSALDSDSGLNGQVTYEAVAGDTSVFVVNNLTGTVSTEASASIDYETRTQYTLVIRALDAGSPQLFSQCIVYLTVIDLNDNAPVFEPTNFTISIYEDISTSVSVAKVLAKDIDSGSNSVFTYSISPSTHFNVHPTNGIITTVAAFDREAQSAYSLTVEATDQGVPALKGTSYVQVQILDKNDNTPVINGTYDTSLPENTPTGSLVFTITASDVDEGSNADLLYAIVSGNTNSDWKIESELGIVQNANSLDRETTVDYHLVIVVADKGIPAKSSSVTASLTITDINDNTPMFSSAAYAFNIDENVNTGSTAGRITASDADTGGNAALQYSLVYTQTGASNFAVDLASGDIRTIGNLDRETADTYILLCRVTDNGSPQLSSEVQVNITITDLNDHGPVFGSSSYTGSVTENSAVGTDILTVVATDKDIGINADITFSIDSSTADGIRAAQLLTVGSSSGIITTKAAIDRETDPIIIFSIVATDGGTIPQSSLTNVSISVVDQNDNNPIFTSLFLNLEVAYDGSCTNLITTVTAVDSDIGSNGLVNYFLVQNTNSHLFAVADTTGDVTLKATATANTRYVIYIMAQDNGATTRTSLNNQALRIDAFNPAANAISVYLSASKSYFTAVEQNFVNDLTLVYQSVYPNAIVKVWCVEERDGLANDNTLGRRRLLATGDKPVTVHMVVLSDNSTDSVANVGVTKPFLSSANAVNVVADSTGSPLAAITGAGWSGYGIEQVTPYQQTVVVAETPWVQTPTGIAVIVCSIVGFLLLLLLVSCLIYRCCAKRRKRPITPVRPVTSEINEPIEPKKDKEPLPRNIQGFPVVGSDDLKKGIRPAVLSLPVPYRPPTKRLNNADILKLDQPVYGNSLLAGDFDGMAIDPASGKLYEYSTLTKERRWVSNQDGKAITASNMYDDDSSEYLKYPDDV